MAINCVQVLDKEGCNLWDVAEYLLLAEESKAGKQNSAWELRWKTLSKRDTRYVNVIYRNNLQSKINSELVLQYITDKEG